MQVANASEVPFRRVFKIRKISARFFCQTKSGKAYAHDKRTYRERSALKGRVFKIEILDVTIIRM